MSARDELARVLMDAAPPGGDPDADRWFRRYADAVLSAWLPTLAEDEALVEALASGEVGRHYRAASWSALSLDAQARWLDDHRRSLALLATTLCPPSPALVEAVDSPEATS